MLVEYVARADELPDRAAVEVPVLCEAGGGAQCALLAAAADAQRRVAAAARAWGCSGRRSARIDAYDPYLDVDFSPRRGDGPGADGYGQAA
ncbi:hypothetical protein [Streptomyces mirabilis]|uniref:hypothetical protein n=1 Tax=Streptomyces mirabilis TaxID=68239 RepID=UPI0036B075E8